MGFFGIKKCKQNTALNKLHFRMYAFLLQDFIIKIELEKAENGSLGFALVGGRNGRAILIKAISPDSIADLDGRLQVGDILLKVMHVLHYFGLHFL